MWLCLNKVVTAGTCRTALGAVCVCVGGGGSSENMSSKIYTFSTMQNIGAQHELYKVLHSPRIAEALMTQLVRKIQRQADS